MAKSWPRLIEAIEVPFVATGSVPMPEGILIAAFCNDPRTFPGIDASRSPDFPRRVLFDRDRFGGFPTPRVLCRCRDRFLFELPSYTDKVQYLPAEPVELRQCIPQLEGWLNLDVFLGQCTYCLQVYWG